MTLSLENLKNEEYISFVDERPGHDKRCTIDSNRIETELFWSPKVDLNTGLNFTIQWYTDSKN